METLNMVFVCAGIIHGVCMLKNYKGSLSLFTREAYYAYAYYIITAYLASNIVYHMPPWVIVFNIVLVGYLFASDWRKVITFN